MLNEILLEQVKDPTVYAAVWSRPIVTKGAEARVVSAESFTQLLPANASKTLFIINFIAPAWLDTLKAGW